MPTVHIDKVGEMAIIECAGRFGRTDAFGNLTRPHRGRLIWPHLRHKNPFPPAC